MSAKVSSYLSTQQASADEETAAVFGKLEELYNKKLWHQLTLKTLDAVKLPHFSQTGKLKELYDNFLSDFEHRINPLALMEITMYTLRDIPDKDECVKFVEKIKEKIKGNKEASILAETALGNIYIRSRELPQVKRIIEATQSALDELDGVTTVHSRFYELSSDFYKLQGDHANYYREALRFLGCIDVTQLPKDRQHERAYSLSLAALLGEGIYNFGELLAHPILDAVRNTDKQWIVDLLYAFNSGDIAKFNDGAGLLQKQPDLANAAHKLKMKICLLCLMEMTFKRPSNNRRITFQEVADETKLPIGEIELLIMKALSLSLVRGSIDQVDQCVTMTWVQPRVLDISQISTMQKRLAHWCQDVKNMEMLVENKAHDILT